MLWGYMCFRIKERVIVIIKGVIKRFLCEWVVILGVGCREGSEEKVFIL